MEKQSVYDKMTHSEKLVSDYLTDFGIYWIYEHPVVIKDEGERQRNYYPDFYLPEFGLFVEVCGAPREKDYKRRSELYYKNHIPVIFVHTYKEEDKWKEHLIFKIAEKTVDRSGSIQGLILGNLFRERK